MIEMDEGYFTIEASQQRIKTQKKGRQRRPSFKCYGRMAGKYDDLRFGAREKFRKAMSLF